MKLFLLLRHRATVVQGEGVLLFVETYHAAVFELDADVGCRVARCGERALLKNGDADARPARSLNK